MNILPECMSHQPIWYHFTYDCREFKCKITNRVTSPTRVTSQSQSMIDLFFTNIPIQGHCETLFLDISDHHAILARIVSSTSARFARGTSSVKGRRLHQIDWDNFRHELDMALTEGFDTQNIELMMSSLHKTVTAVLDKHAPITVRHKKNDAPVHGLLITLCNVSVIVSGFTDV